MFCIPMQRLVQVELSELRINDELLRTTRLRRAPTWNELFQAIHPAVERLPAGFCRKGPIAVNLTADSKTGGRCLLYAAFTWASLQILVRNRAGINLGDIGIKLFGGPNGERVLCPSSDPQNAHPSGGYHAWCLIERFPGMSNATENNVLIVDFAYHWFKQAVRPPEQIAGPEQFLLRAQRFC